MFRLVERAEFYKRIGPKDIILSIVGSYPYKAIFKERRSDQAVGYVQDHGTGKESEYYLLRSDK